MLIKSIHFTTLHANSLILHNPFWETKSSVFLLILFDLLQYDTDKKLVTVEGFPLQEKKSQTTNGSQFCDTDIMI